jgi:hypothetical protein
MITVHKAAEMGAGRGGGIAPGPHVLGAPGNFLLGPSHFFLVKYFCAKGKIFVFSGQITEIWYEILR